MAEQRNIRLGLAGLNQTPMDWHGNLQRIRMAMADAKDQQVDVLCLPELAMSGYGCEDMFLHRETSFRALRMVEDLAADVGDEVVMIGLPLWLEEEEALFNAVAILNQGAIRGFALKSHLARTGIHYEPRWFNPWPAGKIRTVYVGGESVLVGTLTFETRGFVFAMEICEDAWVKPDQRPCRLIKHAHYVFNASASHFSMGKADIRENIVRESSRLFGIGYGYANLVGCESGRSIYDGELLFAEDGRIVQRSERLYLNDVNLVVLDTFYEPREAHANIRLKSQPRPQPQAVNRTVNRQSVAPEEEFGRAASLALFDYMRKSRSRGFTLSLSGGVDSSTVAVLVWVMAYRLLHELSPEDRAAKLAYFTDLDYRVPTPEALVGQLLTTVYQATRNSGDITSNAASQLAEGIGARHLAWNVDDLVEDYKRHVSDAIGRELTWQTDDIALQNIQARVRGPGVWMLANLSGSLLLSTSNRSEVAVGYATMDGDTCGGLAPIAGVEKTFLRRWLRLMEQKGLEIAPALPPLHAVNEQQPTAELRPPEHSQEDEKDLMPYEVLDALEEALIANRKNPCQALDDLRAEFGGQLTTQQLYQWTKKFCRMFAISQWKRERYAPAFHLDDRNLDPKTWARYPILNGAFTAELEELDRYAKTL